LRAASIKAGVTAVGGFQRLGEHHAGRGRSRYLEQIASRPFAVPHRRSPLMTRPFPGHRRSYGQTIRGFREIAVANLLRVVCLFDLPDLLSFGAK
jgi:hypothetical protein